MKLHMVTIMVRSLENSIKFYQELVGLQMVNQIKLERGQIVFLANKKEETVLELIAFKGEETVQTKKLVMSYSADKPLEIIRTKAFDLGYSPSAIIKEGMKPEHFTVQDPDGITVEFVGRKG